MTKPLISNKITVKTPKWITHTPFGILEHSVDAGVKLIRFQYFPFPDSPPVGEFLIDFGVFPCWLYNLQIFSSLRGQGWGHKMMQALVCWLKAKQYTACHLHVDPDNYAAIRIYHKAGFIRDREMERKKRPVIVLWRSTQEEEQS